MDRPVATCQLLWEAYQKWRQKNVYPGGSEDQKYWDAFKTGAEWTVDECGKVLMRPFT